MQLKEEIDRTRQESQDSTDTAFEEAMEELDRISLEAEQELKAKSVFRDLAGSQDDIAAWEAQMEEERSAGQFFKQLYVDPERAKNARASNAAATKEVHHGHQCTAHHVTTEPPPPLPPNTTFLAPLERSQRPLLPLGNE